MSSLADDPLLPWKPHRAVVVPPVQPSSLSLQEDLNPHAPHSLKSLLPKESAVFKNRACLRGRTVLLLSSFQPLLNCITCILQLSEEFTSLTSKACFNTGYYSGAQTPSSASPILYSCVFQSTRTGAAGLPAAPPVGLGPRNVPVPVVMRAQPRSLEHVTWKAVPARSTQQKKCLWFRSAACFEHPHPTHTHTLIGGGGAGLTVHTFYSCSCICARVQKTVLTRTSQWEISCRRGS